MLSEKPIDNRFLIVDNDPFWRDTLRRALYAMGANTVDIATNANRAIVLCKSSCYDMVLAEYNLGEGTNGQQLLEELRSNKLLGNVSAFIILTSETNRDIVLSALEYRPDDYLAKPSVPKLLEERVKRRLCYKTHLHSIFQSIDNENFPKAIEECEKYIDSKGSFLNSGLRLLAELYCKSEEFDKAQKIYESEADSDWAILGLAKVFLYKNQLEKSEELFLKLIENNYMHIEAYEALSDIYLKNQSNEKAEEIMAKGVLVSPLSIRCQQYYAGLCEHNHHHDTAIKTWRSIIKISRESNAESVDNHLELSRCLMDFCEMNDCSDDESMNREIFRHINAARNKFDLHEDHELKSMLLESRAFFGKGNTEKGQEIINIAKKMIEESPDKFSENTHLEMAKSLNVSGDSESAQEMLETLISENQDVGFLSRADKILEGPVTESGKEKIVKINDQGISFYESGDFERSCDCFREAKLFSPKNIELNINLAQALFECIKNSNDVSVIKQWLDEAEKSLSLIKNISENHAKYNSYDCLKNDLEDLKINIAPS